MTRPTTTGEAPGEELPEAGMPGGDARDDATAASVLSEAGEAPQPGGGGLRQGAVPPERAAGGTAPNAPVNVGRDAGDAAADRDALATAAAAAPEPRPSSQ